MEQNGVFGNGNILPSQKPFNAFARILSGDLTPAYPLDLLEKSGLEEYAGDYLIAKNKPELDERWKESVEEGKPLQSMSLHHEFLIPRDTYWKNFNVLTLGIEGNKQELENEVAKLKEMKEIAVKYATNNGWGKNVGLYFHCYPLNSVNTLHLHIVDLCNTGPSYEAQNGKNLSIHTVIECLENELRELNK